MMVASICLYTYCKKKRAEYGLLAQSDFKDYDESKDTELFRRPTGT